MNGEDALARLPVAALVHVEAEQQVVRLKQETKIKLDNNLSDIKIISKSFELLLSEVNRIIRLTCRNITLLKLDKRANKCLNFKDFFQLRYSFRSEGPL